MNLLRYGKQKTILDKAPVIPLWTIEKFGGSDGQVITKHINTWIEHGGLMMVGWQFSADILLTIQGENVFYDKFSNFNGAHLRGVWLPSLPFMNVSIVVSYSQLMVT